MEQYLKLFRTSADYEAASEKPPVSHIVEDVDVKMQPKINNNGHEYVDLCLPSGTLWAKCNVGASIETDYGEMYKYGMGSKTYSHDGQSYYHGMEVPLAETADTAVQVMGGDWRMPTSSDFVELTANTNHTSVENFNNSGVNGMVFSCRNDSSKYIFIPYAGNYSRQIWERGRQGNVWSSTACPDGYPTDSNAYALGVTSETVRVYNYFRSDGFSIRGVIKV